MRHSKSFISKAAASLSALLMAAALWVLPGNDAAAATWGYTLQSNNQVQFWVNDAPWADLHYQLNGGLQQNVRMIANGNNHTYVVSNVPSGTVVRYFFTIGSFSGGAMDTAWTQFTRGSTPTPTPTPTPTATPTPTPTPTPSNVVCFFEHTNYGGASFCSGEGNFHAPSGWNDRASSARVQSGYRAQLYQHSNFTGTLLTLTADEPNFVNRGFNDAMTSFRISRVSTPTPTPTPTATPTPTPTPTSTSCTTQPNVPNFGSNVRIFDPSMSASTIQASLDQVFNAQKDTLAHQFHNRRDALLFKPGTYNVFANLGYNTSIAGLGQNPDDVRINGAVTVDAFNASDQGNATQNFWRSVENLSINTNGGANRWAVAQAAPFRRIHVIGNLDVFPASYGWASGGYISDSRIDGVVASASQQQWYSKDSNYGGWNGSVWNMVFSGVTGAPPTNFSTDPAGLHHTTLATTPISRDVPYIYLDASGNYRLFLPSLRTNASGPSWANGSTPGTSVGFNTVFVARPTDSAATINARLADGCHIVFTPGIYHVNQTLNVTRANTVMLGMGYATIIPDGGVNAIQVANVGGVRIKGMFIDAGTTNSNALLTVGPAGSAGTSHAANPTTIQDVFFRIGGSIAGKATNSLIVNSSNVVIDHIWAWRADHGNSGTVGWTINTADTGVVVNGNNVLATGLFVEHYQKYEVIWNGQGGRTIFFQNEKPYDPPNQAAWTNGTQNGYAAYKVGNNVTSHEAWGLGSYTFFNVNPSVNLYHAYEVPNNANVRFHNMAIVSLGGVGSITRTINDAGPGVNSTTHSAFFLNYP